MPRHKKRWPKKSSANLPGAPSSSGWRKFIPRTVRAIWAAIGAGSDAKLSRPRSKTLRSKFQSDESATLSITPAITTFSKSMTSKAELPDRSRKLGLKRSEERRVGKERQYPRWLRQCEKDK